jgi:hypothetical protein
MLEKANCAGEVIQKHGKNAGGVGADESGCKSSQFGGKHETVHRSGGEPAHRPE